MTYITINVLHLPMHHFPACRLSVGAAGAGAASSTSPRVARAWARTPVRGACVLGPSCRCLAGFGVCPVSGSVSQMGVKAGAGPSPAPCASHGRPQAGPGCSRDQHLPRGSRRGDAGSQAPTLQQMDRQSEGHRAAGQHAPRPVPEATCAA